MYLMGLQVLSALKAAQTNKTALSSHCIELGALRQRTATLQNEVHDVVELRDQLSQTERREQVLIGRLHESTVRTADQIRTLKSENEALRQQLDESTRKAVKMAQMHANADETAEQLKELRRKVMLLEEEKDSAAAAQGERVNTIERLQRMQLDSRLELKHANHKLLDQVPPK